MSNVGIFGPVVEIHVRETRHRTKNWSVSYGNGRQSLHRSAVLANRAVQTHTRKQPGVYVVTWHTSTAIGHSVAKVVLGKEEV